MRLTLTTWNLQGNKGVDAAFVAHQVRERGTDVLLLQEVQRGQARRICRALGSTRSRHWGLKHWPVQTWSEGMAVLGITVPLRVRTYPVTRRWAFWSWRRRLIQIGHTADGLTVVNVHFTPHGPTSEADRAAEVGWLLDRLPADRPVVVGGDFNANPDDPLFDRLRDAGLRDAWLTAHPDADGFTNWHGRRDRPPRRRIDYLWVSAPLEIASMTVPTDDLAPYAALSDHLPLTVSLTL